MSEQMDLQAAMAEVRQQQEELVFDSFDISAGVALGLRMLEIATERSLPVMISVTHGAHSVFRAALPGSVPDYEHWLTRKSGAVLRFGVPSYLVQLQHEARGERFEHRPDVDHAMIAAHGGAFPITVRGVGIIGTASVSGLLQRDDHLLAVEAIRDRLDAVRAG
ncbi:MAG: heme-degrading domain-containing protein [Actinomycetota bacterium]|nr:heme-degrading domain-containing protein [Actinomycetota bacterium]